MNKLYADLANEITKSYESGTTLEEAERLAARFLSAQLAIADELRNADLDARMKKSGTKAVRAAVYMEEATKTEKKPSDTYLEALVSMSAIVADQQGAYDTAEVYRDQLQNYFSIFKDAHVFFRGVAKGRFE